MGVALPVPVTMVGMVAEVALKKRFFVVVAVTIVCKGQWHIAGADVVIVVSTGHCKVAGPAGTVVVIVLLSWQASVVVLITVDTSVRELKRLHQTTRNADDAKLRVSTRIRSCSFPCGHTGESTYLLKSQSPSSFSNDGSVLVAIQTQQHPLQEQPAPREQRASSCYCV